MKQFVAACNSIGVEIEYMPPGYTCVLQPVDVGFNAPFKRHIRDCHHKWCIEKYRGVANAMKLPTPDRDDIVQWVHNAYNKISEESIRKTFRSIGYKCCEFEENDAIDFEYIIENEEEEVEEPKPRKRAEKEEPSVIERMTKNTMVRQVGNTVVRELARGILGVLGLGGKSSRSKKGFF